MCYCRYSVKFKPSNFTIHNYQHHLLTSKFEKTVNSIYLSLDDLMSRKIFKKKTNTMHLV